MPRLLRTALEGVVPPEEARNLESGIDVIGDIAILKLGGSLKGKGGVIGEALLNSLKNVRAVFGQEGAIEGVYRLRKLRHLAGEKRTTTTHRENGCMFRVDVEKCYFSPRLSTERLRIAKMVEKGEKVLNMFAGVGPYSIVIAKKQRDAEVYSSELNETAYELHLENNRLNKVADRVRMIKGDAKLLPSKLDIKFDRTLMPHPSQANDFLQAAATLTRKKGGWIHYYRHVSAGNLVAGEERIRHEVGAILNDDHEMNVRKIREVGPMFLELAADIRFD